MYLDFFGFNEPPFSITPDPKFVFLSKKHEESLAHLIYGITRGGGAGFVQLTGEVGTGKTTISRLLLEQIPEKTNIALILNPTVTPLELIQNICQELKISMRGIKTKLNSLIDKLNKYLLESWSNGENTVVIIDEAQNLPRDTLEQLRLLTNLETNTHKLLQIILIGQPELRTTMRRNDLRQLAQRVTARYHLMPLSADETYEYIQHRIKTAQGNKNIVSKSIAKKVHGLTDGVPRLVNILTDRALLAAYANNNSSLTNKHIKLAAIEVLPETLRPKNKLPIAIALLIVTLISTMLYFIISNNKLEGNEVVINQTLKTNNNEKPFNNASAQETWNKYLQLWDTAAHKKWSKAQCPPVLETGMACLRRQGNLKQIEKQNRPTIIQLENKSLILLMAINEKQIGLLNTSNKTQFVTKNWINDQWLGTYFAIWPMPAELLSDTSSTQLQQWALEMANTIANKTIESNQLDLWIKEFQSSQGLLADGIIGQETQMALSLKAYNGPTLD